MPNWCYNTLSVSGNEKNMKKFYDSLSQKFKEGDCDYKNEILLDFNDFVPRPKSLDITSGSSVVNALKVINKEADFDDYPNLKDKDYEEARNYISNVEKYGHGDWYSWSYENWGTKWNASGVYVSNKDKDFCMISFESAWAPPIPVIDALMEQHPELNVELEYSESGMGFAGKYGREGDHTYDYEGELLDFADCCDRPQFTEEHFEKCEEEGKEAWETCPTCGGSCEFQEEIVYPN